MEYIKPFIGVVIGFTLGQLAILVRWAFTRTAERNNTKALLSLEIQRNLDLVSDYWSDLSLEPDEKEEKENKADRLVRRTREIPFPPLSSMVWKSNIGKLAKCLNKNELEITWLHYETSALIETIRDHLHTETKPDQYPYRRASRMLRNAGIQSATYKTESAGHMMEYRELIGLFLKNGNPLK